MQEFHLIRSQKYTISFTSVSGWKWELLGFLSLLARDGGIWKRDLHDSAKKGIANLLRESYSCVLFSAGWPAHPLLLTQELHTTHALPPGKRRSSIYAHTLKKTKKVEHERDLVSIPPSTKSTCAREANPGRVEEWWGKNKTKKLNPCQPTFSYPKLNYIGRIPNLKGENHM